MANSKISALPSATTPLAGTEVLPVVQGGITEQVSVANLTAGRSVAASNLAVDANSATAAVRITQLGAGNALLVEDSASPDSTPFVIDAAGNVIQGTTASTTGGLTGQTYQQHVVANISGAGALFAGWNAAQPNAVNIARSTSGAVGSFTTSAAGTSSSIRFFFDDGIAFIRGASIDAVVDGTAGTNDMPGRLVFSTTADGASTPTERLRIASDGLVSLQNSSGLSIARIAVTSPATTDGNVFSGTYTPTLFNTTNVAASTAYECQYMRVGNTVTVSGQVDIDPTLAVTDTVLGMSLPIASALAANRQLGGTGAIVTPSRYGEGAAINADLTNDRAQFLLRPSSINNSSYAFSFTYRVI